LTVSSNSGNSGGPVLIINLKNYREILGDGALRLVEAAERASDSTGAEIIVAPPVPMLYAIASGARIPVFSQRVDNKDEGKSTGSVIPEELKESRCAGSILNHSESRVPIEIIALLIPRMKKLGLSTCLCAESAAEVSKMASLSPEYLAIEPPELIGTGIAVSKARPEVVSGSVLAAREAGYRGRVLCGAGIVSGEDASAAVRLGAEGILVASSVVKAKDDWEGKIRELSSALLSPV
jgi:triosephosphate isomerase (TIM)